MSTSFLSHPSPKPSSTTIVFNASSDNTNTNTKSSSVFTTPPQQPSCGLPTLPSHMTQSCIVKNLVRPL